MADAFRFVTFACFVEPSEGSCERDHQDGCTKGEVRSVSQVVQGHSLAANFVTANYVLQNASVKGTLKPLERWRHPLTCPRAVIN
jgi:hypothetical protein